MPLVDQIRAARRILEEADAAAASHDAADQSHSAKRDALEATVAKLRDANTILRARMGEPADDGGPVAEALRAAAVVVFRSPSDSRTAILWLKSRGWGESAINSFNDPVTRDTFLLANAIDIQARRDLAPFKTLLNNP